MEDKRKQPRYDVTAIVQYKDGILGLNKDSVTKDVSINGICFFSEKKFKINQVVKLRLFYDIKSKAKMIRARVAWSRDYTDNVSKGYLTGVEFLAI